MSISRIKLPRVPNNRGVVHLCTVSSGTSPLGMFALNIDIIQNVLSVGCYNLYFGV